ncbi:MAG: EamA family transporter, partial [Eubacteriales bacterium]
LVSGAQIAGIACVIFGVIGLGVVESREDEDLRKARQDVANFRYAKSWLALALPLAYCFLDAAGTFADNGVIEKIATMTASGEDSANVAYELTFLLAGIVSFIYVVPVKKQKLFPKMEVPKYVGAIFETAGQFAYIYAVADEDHLMMSAPIISSYCILSVVWSRILLKEKLSKKHYLMIAIAAVGIAILGFLDA